MDLSFTDIVSLITIAINIVTLCFLASITYMNKKMDEQFRNNEKKLERIKKGRMKKSSEDEI